MAKTSEKKEGTMSEFEQELRNLEMGQVAFPYESTRDKAKTNAIVGFRRVPGGWVIEYQQFRHGPPVSTQFLAW